MANFFIRRPIFAWVLAIILMMAGALAILQLPVAQYPTIAPPAVSVSANYPGADAQTVQDTVTQVIEQNMNGIDNLMYMSSTSDSAGSVTITLTFQSGTDPDIAQVQVQNKLQLATPLLPQEVQQQGISVEKSSSSYLMVAGFVSDNPDTTQDDISDYVASNVKDTLSRLNGVGDVQLFGAQYAMRIWLDADLLNKYKLTPVDVINQLKVQNDQIAAGQLGGTPALPGQQLNASIIAQTRLKNPEEFGKVTLRVNSDGSVVRLKDVARVELGGENYNVIARINGKPAAGLGIKLATGANALDTAKAIKAKLAELQPFFPQGMKVLYPYDTTPFVQLSIHEVVKTLFEAIMLVFLVMYLFLQNMRATLIPTIAVPVVLLGTFAILAAFGYSINTLTMFGMVLAIGLLVDDAIVVVENVERVMMEDKLPPKEATEKSMSQIQGALVGIAMVLSAVFIPMAFFGWFNTTFDHSVNHYTNSVGKILGSTGRYLLIYALIVAGMVVLFLRLPSSFLPEEDQGVFLTMIQLPAGATQERTQKVLDQVTDYYLKNEKANVESVFTVNGFSFSGQAQNAGMAFVSLKPWEERNGDENSAEAVIHRAKMELGKIRDGFVIPFNMPAIVELGTATGFDFELIDQAGLGHDALTQARNQLLGMAAQHPASLVSVRPNGLEDTAQFKLEVDQEKAQALGVSLSDINQTISTALGGTYVNDFIDRGRVKKVYVQADAKFRMLPEDVDKLYVRSANGEMVPFSAFTTSHWVYGSPRLERYNGLPSMEIQGEAAPGTSSGDAMALMENLASKLPAGIGYDWTGMSYQERLSGNQAPALVAISFVVVFLCLAALYESWSIPVSVMLVVPLGIVGVLLAATLFNQKNDVYFMVGLLTTIGLSAKNAILIVEFAKDLMEKEGKGIVEATLMAVRMRLRPILMTSLAFILGVLPLAISNGAGSGAQNAVGIGVMGGMVSATLLAIFFVPVFFVVIRRCFKG
ncbi:multidrug efflux RND transporter permease subunit AcrF [Escherichia coli]|uniref:multidrug efflux RND transporter permease subunit AcrF n=1 Tax=Escherichia coli TaxID=562 RepID=UPI0010ABC89A|nr:multidrug efflux RND transporter permease subunit AcrF [Escherichia coli]EER0625226.1 multidrug efflux RND transporter permease subunit AcrF [Escherichia coli]EER5243417.1 multidrug efflux RND transporter permease subunit AcrF [Escherichia coli]EES3607365.1 multidrug efflux RND transporter permease subunit AcrF [Escherichia coli]EET0794970.1 multidrug efflux RND transporter permease subunit AcrF [Escherichia coli]EEV9126200.1 multidrug efflux RND transporter permease subunit AcrF [Escherich